MLRALTVATVVLPLAIDTFVLATALGAAGVDQAERLRSSLILSAFEAGMPVVGVLVGAAIGSAVGGWSAYVAALVLAFVGASMLRPGSADEDGVRLLETARGWSIVALGLGISLDELAIGFGSGLLGLPLLLLVALIGVQAFLAAQVGMRLGSRLAERARNAGQRLAGALLVIAAALVLSEKLVRL